MIILCVLLSISLNIHVDLFYSIWREKIIFYDWDGIQRVREIGCSFLCKKIENKKQKRHKTKRNKTKQNVKCNFAHLNDDVEIIKLYNLSNKDLRLWHFSYFCFLLVALFVCLLCVSLCRARLLLAGFSLHLS